MYSVGFRDANQIFGASDEAVKDPLAGLTNILALLTKSLQHIAMESM